MSNVYYKKRPAVLEEIAPYKYVLLEASAGTGKTYTIAAIVADLILKGYAINKILLMTFTELATKELKERIRSMLLMLLDGINEQKEGAAPDSFWAIGEKEQHYLRESIAAFDSANISTIHGFCHNILASFPLLADKPLGGTLADEKTYLKLAVEHILRYMADGEYGEWPYHLLDEYLRSGGSTEGLIGLLESVRNYASPIRPSADYAAIELASQRLTAALLALPAQEIARGSKLKANYEICTKPLTYGNFKKFRDAAVYLWENKISKFAPAEQEEYGAALASLPTIEAALLTELNQKVADELGKIKAWEGVTTFNDLLKVVQHNLQKDDVGPAFCQKLREKYEICLIDEFQDTDPVQWSIFKSIYLAREAQDTSIKLYLVGDPKQAIYSFRGADVNTYLKAREEIAQVAGCIKNLTTNYRSTEEMVRAFNAIFAQDARGNEKSFFQGAITYPAVMEAHKKADQNYLATVDLKQHLPAVILATWPHLEEINGEKLKKWYGCWLANYLAKLLEKPPQIIAEGQKARPLLAQDVYILAECKAELKQMAIYLKRAGVPYVYYKEGELFGGTEAADFVDLLKAIASPHADKKRLKAFLGPFFAIPLSELAKYRDLPSNHPLVSRLFSWHQLALCHDFAGLISAIMSESGLRERFIMAAKQRELMAFERIGEILSREALTKDVELADLIELLYQYITGSRPLMAPDEEARPQELQSNAVRLLTMHKSKGLEAEVVAIYGGFRNPQNKYNKPALIYPYLDHESGERRLYISDKNAEHGPVGAEILLKNLRGEKERLLYVALTRAKRQLIMPAFNRGQITAISYSSLGCSYYSVVNERLETLNQVPNGLAENLFKICEIPTFYIYDQRPNGVTKTVVLASASAANASGPEADEALIDPMNSIKAFADSKEQFRGPIITSYTRMKHSATLFSQSPDEDFDIISDIALFSPAKSSLPKGAAFGTLLHKLLEKLDYRTLLGGYLALAAPGKEFIAQEEWASLVTADIAAICKLYHFAYDHFAAELTALLYRTLTKELLLNKKLVLPPLATLTSRQKKHEVEFYYPINALPALTKPLFQNELIAEKGFVKGYIDLLFEHEGKLYVLDWKSDTLPSYEPAALKAHVLENYHLQAALYALALYKMLLLAGDAHPYDRFGGIIYYFVRAEGAENGLYYECPSLAELESNYAQLCATGTLAAWIKDE